MIRRSTLGWAVGAAVVVVGGIAVAAVAATHPAHSVARASAGSSASARPTAAATAPRSSTPATTPTSTASAPGAAGTAPSTPVTVGVPSAPASEPAAPVRRVSPSVSYYALSGTTLTLGGGVSGLVDSSGTCTVTATNGSSTVTGSFTATAGPSSTDCGAMSITSSTLHSGRWTLTLDYSSPRAKGVSTPEAVTL